jgi:hypothetical protein
VRATPAAPGTPAVGGQDRDRVEFGRNSSRNEHVSFFLIFCLTVFDARVGFGRESRVIIARESVSRSWCGETRAPVENRSEVAVRRVWRIVRGRKTACYEEACRR